MISKAPAVKAPGAGGPGFQGLFPSGFEAVGAPLLRLSQGRVAMLSTLLFRSRTPFLPSLRDSVAFSLASDAAFKRRFSTATFVARFFPHAHRRHSLVTSDALDNPVEERPFKGPRCGHPINSGL
jgi:hypothetical protein